MIKLDNIQKCYTSDGDEMLALKGVTFSINSGEFVAVIGPSGSGKSTLLNIMSFLDRPTGGAYTFLDRDMNTYTDDELAAIRNREMGFIFQSFNLLGRATVYENVEMPLIYARLSKSERDMRVRQAVAAVGLAEKLSSEANRLSGGQRQRVAIARALVNNPKVIFADEPTGNLDSVSGAHVMKILESLNREGRTIILVTHDPAIARYARRTITIRDGMLADDSTLPTATPII